MFISLVPRVSYLFCKGADFSLVESLLSAVIEGVLLSSHSRIPFPACFFFIPSDIHLPRLPLGRRSLPDTI